MPRGRPVGSTVRQNIVNMLAILNKPLYGYLIHKIYIQIYVPCTRENIYYHLRKGVKLGELILSSIKQEKGQFSWGGVVEKHYFALGEKAKPQGVPEEIKTKLERIRDDL